MYTLLLTHDDSTSVYYDNETAVSQGDVSVTVKREGSKSGGLA